MQTLLALKPTLRHLGLALVLVMLLTSALLLRAQRAGARALSESDAAFDRGQLQLSINHASDALRWYFPFAEHVEAAQVRLLAIAEGAESTGDLRLALTAWSALRSGLKETAHGFSAREPRLEEANRAIVRLLPRATGLMAPAPDAPQLAAAYAASERSAPVLYVARSFGMGLLLLGIWLLFLRQQGRGFAFGMSCLALGLFAWVFAAIGA